MILQRAPIDGFYSLEAYRASLRSSTLQSRLEDLESKLKKAVRAKRPDETDHLQQECKQKELEIQVSKLGASVRLGVCFLIIDDKSRLVCCQTAHGNQTWGLPKGKENPKRDHTLRDLTFREAQEEFAFSRKHLSPTGPTLPVLGMHLNALPDRRVVRRQLNYTHKLSLSVVLPVQGTYWIKLNEEENRDHRVVHSAAELLELLRPRFERRPESTLAMIEAVNLAKKGGYLKWMVPDSMIPNLH